MRVLGVSYTDSGGGAAIAALRLTMALRDAGIDAELGVVSKNSVYPFVIELPAQKSIFSKIAKRLCARLERSLFHHFKTDNLILHSLNLYSKIDVNWINSSKYDVIHLHWINHDMLSIKDIAKIRKPVFWTLHDSWPVCGAEHHPDVLNHDTRYIEGYQRIVSRAFRIDISRLAFNIKRNAWAGTRFHLLCPSRWQASIAEASALRAANPSWSIRVIPNVIDSVKFAPSDMVLTRRLLAIDEDALVIGFGSAYEITDKRDLKGGYLVPALLESLNTKLKNRNMVLVIFGPMSQSFAAKVSIPMFATGKIQNDTLLRLIYSACDVFVLPSLVENLPLTAMEAQACGVPVAAFRTGGLPDVIEHKLTGYLAEPFDPEDLAHGVEWCLANRNQSGQMARQKACRDFDGTQIAAETIKYYSEFADTNRA